MLSGSLRAVYTARSNAIARSRSGRKPCRNSQMFAWLGFQRRSDCTSPNCTGTLGPVRQPAVHMLSLLVVQLWKCESLVMLSCPTFVSTNHACSCCPCGNAGATAVADIPLEPDIKSATLLDRSGSSSSEAAVDVPFVHHRLKLKSAVTYLPHPDKVITGTKSMSLSR